MDADKERLKLFATLYYVLGGLTAVFALIPVIHLVIGIAMLSGAFPPMGKNGANEFPAHFIGGFIVVMASIFILFGEIIAVLLLMTGRRLSQCRSYTFCFAGAVISCLIMPLGTLLGVFTLVHLQKQGVKELFSVSAER